MAVLCPGCGRQYDVTLFQFDATVRCDCGQEVGRDPCRSRAGAQSEPRFLVDAMLGRLARWLRLLGYDAEYEDELDDAQMVRRAEEEDRILLTRDLGLLDEKRPRQALEVHSEKLGEQLRQVVSVYGLDPRRRLLTRCSRCNLELEPISRQEARSRIPARVLLQHVRFGECPRCRRVYWRGTHAERLLRRLGQVLDSGRGPPA